MLTLVLLAGCRKPLAPSRDSGAVLLDAGKPDTARATDNGLRVNDILERVRTPSEQAALEADLANLKARSGTCPFELVAVAPKTHLHLAVVGSRVLAWGKGLQAVADGDEPLLADEFLKGVAYDAEKQVLMLAGSFPNLLAFRFTDAYCNTQEFVVNAFVRRGGHWVSRALPNRGSSDGSPPYGFVTWANGGLLVDSAWNNCGAYTSAGLLRPLEKNERGTKFTYYASNGTSSHPTLGLESRFITWGVSSAGDTLALVGSYVQSSNSEGDPIAPTAVVMRKHGAGPFRATQVGPVTELAVISMLQRVREFGNAALFLPPPARDDGTPPFGYPAVGDEMNWKAQAKSLFIITDGGTKELTWRTPVEQDCHLIDAVLDAEDVWAIMQCPMPPASLTDASENYVKRVSRLIRIAPDGSKSLIELPKLQRQGDLVCEPEHIELRPPDDIWLSATCGNDDASFAALFRRGHAQVPVEP